MTNRRVFINLFILVMIDKWISCVCMNVCMKARVHVFVFDVRQTCKFGCSSDVHLCVKVESSTSQQTNLYILDAELCYEWAWCQSPSLFYFPVQ